MKCDECKYWHPLYSEKGRKLAQEEDANTGEVTDIGNCHRFPPIWIGEIQTLENQYAFEWPFTESKDWCGEFSM